MKLDGKSQTGRNTSKYIILGNNLEMILFVFFLVGHWNMRFCRKQGEKSLKLNVLLNRAFLTVIKQEDFEILREVFSSFFLVLLHRSVFANERVSFKKSKK